MYNDVGENGTNATEHTAKEVKIKHPLDGKLLIVVK